MENVILKYECELCNKYFSQQSSRNRHIKEKHLKPNMYQCKHCESRFSKKYNLQVHLEKVHSKDCKKMKCCHCKRIFTKSCLFKKHFKGSRRCAETNVTLNADFENTAEKDAESVAESVLKELKQLQLDIQTSKIDNSDCLESESELTKIDKSKVQIITVKDNLYPLGNFKLLKTQAITRTDGLKYFICEFCSKEFRKTYNFLRHRRIHTKVRPFVCVLCKATFPTTAQLKTHCSIHKLHERFGIFQKLYNCPKCEEKFCSIQQFDKHIRLSGCKVSFKCPKCCKHFRTLKTLLRHEHPEKDNELEMLKPFIPAPLSEELHLSPYNTSSCECRSCGLQVKEGISFKHHVKRHENLFRNQCAKCQKSFATQPTLRIHSKSHLKVKRFNCHYCNNCFETPQSCRRHMETHLKRLLQTHEEMQDTICLFPTLIDNGNNDLTVTTTLPIIKRKKAGGNHQEKTGANENLKYKCAECGKSFRYKCWLKKHFKCKHTNDLPFKCDICCREFRTKQSLDSHSLIHSTKRLKLTCQVCGRQYASSKSLKLHLRIHTQEKPFSCRNCNNKFRTSGHLIQHCKTHHKAKL